MPETWKCPLPCRFRFCSRKSPCRLSSTIVSRRSLSSLLSADMSVAKMVDQAESITSVSEGRASERPPFSCAMPLEVWDVRKHAPPSKSCSRERTKWNCAFAAGQGSDRALSRIPSGLPFHADRVVRRRRDPADFFAAAERDRRPRLRSVFEIRGAQSDLLFQRSRDDGGRLQGLGTRSGRAHLRVDGKHFRVRRRLCGQSRDSLRCCSSRWKNRQRQTGPGLCLRRESNRHRRQLP